MRKNERGFVLALAMFGIVALTVVGMASIFMASGEAEIAGNLRRQRAVQRCADAGVTAMTAQLPDPSFLITNNDVPFTYNVGTQLVATKGHYSGTTTVHAVSILDPSQVPGIFTPGENKTNGVAQSQIPFRIVSTCTGPGNAQAEQSVGVLYRIGR